MIKENENKIDDILIKKITEYVTERIKINNYLLERLLNVIMFLVIPTHLL